MPRASAKSSGSRRKVWFGAILLSAIGVSSAMAAFKVREFALVDPQFTLSRDHRDTLTIQGVHYTPRARIQRVFAEDFDHSIYLVPLGERRRRLMGIDWIEDASVSRIWPNRLAVRDPLFIGRSRRGTQREGPQPGQASCSP